MQSWACTTSYAAPGGERLAAAAAIERRIRGPDASRPSIVGERHDRDADRRVDRRGRTPVSPPRPSVHTVDVVPRPRPAPRRARACARRRRAASSSRSAARSSRSDHRVGRGTPTGRRSSRWCSTPRGRASISAATSTSATASPPLAQVRARISPPGPTTFAWPRKRSPPRTPVWLDESQTTWFSAARALVVEVEQPGLAVLGHARRPVGDAGRPGRQARRAICGAVEGQRAGRLRERLVVVDEHADPADRGVERGERVAGRGRPATSPAGWCTLRWRPSTPSPLTHTAVL